jgi:hypothetical protein
MPELNWTLVALSVAVIPEGGDKVRVTVPENVSSDVIAMIEAPEAPC